MPGCTFGTEPEFILNNNYNVWAALNVMADGEFHTQKNLLSAICTKKWEIHTCFTDCWDNMQFDHLVGVLVEEIMVLCSTKLQYSDIWDKKKIMLKLCSFFTPFFSCKDLKRSTIQDYSCLIIIPMIHQTLVIEDRLGLHQGQVKQLNSSTKQCLGNPLMDYNMITDTFGNNWELMIILDKKI